jgi:hypothetical protein
MMERGYATYAKRAGPNAKAQSRYDSDFLCALVSWRLSLKVLLFKNYVNGEDSVGRYSYRLWLRNKFRVTFFQ